MVLKDWKRTALTNTLVRYENKTSGDMIAHGDY